MKHTLWTLLVERKIEIPVFQRDYAQGRLNKTILRRDFLRQLLSALKGDGSNGCLDFVYSMGDEDGDSKPLDGQQRLTTLWLLYWYIAIQVLKADDLNEALDMLSKFSYRTRHSSSDFLKSLCNLECVETLAGADNISEAIKDSTWFVKSWLHDPTVIGMLTTLSGTETQYKPNMDGIRQLFGNDKEELRLMWVKLTSPVNECPLYFDHLNIENIEVKAPDLLYIKMNARGKALSPYEKFKAQWLKTIPDKQKAFDYSLLIDNDWNDVFWNGLKTDGIDQRKMAFYTRFYLCRLFEFLSENYTNKDGGRILISAPLYRKEDVPNNRYEFVFNGIDDFAIPGQSESEEENHPSSLLIPSAFEVLKKLFETLNTLGVAYISSCLPTYSKDFSYIPDSDKPIDNGNYCVKPITMADQVILYSIYCYLIHSERPNIESFRRWMRVCCNIAVNTNSGSNAETHLGIISNIKKMAKTDCDNIYSTVVSLFFNEKMPSTGRAFWEESVKAHEIMKNGVGFENKVIEAEEFAFFKGAIRFLFLNDLGNVDWSNFDRKFATAKDLFCDTGLTEIAKKDDIANRVLISYCHDWEKQIEKEVNIISYENTSWRSMLLSEDYIEPVHNLLLFNTISQDLRRNGSYDDIYRKESHKHLVEGNYIDCLKGVSDNQRAKYFIRWYDNGMCLYLRNHTSDTYFLSSDRVSIINALSQHFEVTQPKKGGF